MTTSRCRRDQTVRQPVANCGPSSTARFECRVGIAQSSIVPGHNGGGAQAPWQGSSDRWSEPESLLAFRVTVDMDRIELAQERRWPSRTTRATMTAWVRASGVTCAGFGEASIVEHSQASSPFDGLGFGALLVGIISAATGLRFARVPSPFVRWG